MRLNAQITTLVVIQYARIATAGHKEEKALRKSTQQNTKKVPAVSIGTRLQYPQRLTWREERDAWRAKEKEKEKHQIN
jgi:hypothetical protein